MKIKYLQLIGFCREKRGAITIATALMFPTLIGFYSIAIDGARFNSERSRLTDALNHSVYAVAATDNRNATANDKKVNTDLVANYMSYYMPAETINRELINVEATLVNNDDEPEVVAVDYKVNAGQIIHPIFKLNQNGEKGFNQNIRIQGNGLSGIVRRSIISSKIDAADYVFVVDFSTSMTFGSAERNMTREKLLKKVVRQLGTQLFELDNGSTIGIVPFSIGVPAILNKTNYAGPSSKELGCTYAGKMHDAYESIDWSFWYNKPGKSAGENISLVDFIKKTDEVLRWYYVNVIAKANGYKDDKIGNNWLIDQGYCYKSGGKEDKLICDADPKSSIHNEDNQFELEKNLRNYLKVSHSEDTSRGLMNSITMDIAGTLSGDYLFNEANVKTLVAFQNRLGDIPFYRTCAKVFDVNEHYSHSGNTYERIKQVTKPLYYLINLTDNKNIFDEFDAMSPQGETESLSGLLRAVPLLAQGKNPRKYIFVISDGEDTKKSFREELMTQHHLCDVIRDGLKKYPKDRAARESDIFYISLIKNGTVTEWGKNCVGTGNAFFATNLQELMDTLGKIMFKNTIEYINPDESSDNSSDKE